MTSIYWLCISIFVGGVGAILFITGLLLPLVPLVAAGISLIAASLIGLLMIYFCCLKPITPLMPEGPRYSTNNMNTIVNGMKRNKSDTDLELINKQTEATESGQIV